MFLTGLAFFTCVENAGAVTVLSQPLPDVARKATVICLGVLIDSKTTFHSYEYGESSKTWDETSMVFSVKECLKGSLPTGQPCSGTYYLPSFSEYNDPARKEQECPVMDGSGIEDSLRTSEIYLFFLDTSLKSNTIIRVEPATAKEAVRQALSSP